MVKEIGWAVYLLVLGLILWQEMKSRPPKCFASRDWKPDGCETIDEAIRRRAFYPRTKV